MMQHPNILFAFVMMAIEELLYFTFTFSLL